MLGTGVNWNGTYFVRPQAASRIDSSALSPVQLGSANKVVLMGEMGGLLEPKKLLRIDSSLGNILLAPEWEEARLAASLVFNPSKGLPGANEVYLLPVNPATQSAKTDKDAGSNDSLILTSLMYGILANQIKRKIEAGTNKGSKLTISFQGNTEVFDDLAKDGFSLRYKGAGTTVAVVVTASALTTSVTGAAGDNLNLAFADFGTVQALIDAINATGKYEAIAVTKSPKTDLCSQLDLIASGNASRRVITGATAANPCAVTAIGHGFQTGDTVYIENVVGMVELNGQSYTVTVTGVDTFTLGVDSSAFTAYTSGGSAERVLTTTSNLQAIVDKINERSGYVTAQRATGAGAVPAVSDWAYLTGGANGATANSDWLAAFEELKTVDIDLIVPLTASASIHAMGDAHCTEMSGPAGKSERRQFVGGALQNWSGEVNRATAATALKDAVALLNGDRTVHVGLGSKHYDASGAIKLYPAYMTAVMYAGIAGGAAVVTPLTRKQLNCVGLEVELRKAEIDDLLEGHVAVPIPDLVQGAGFVISRQITTWAQDTDLYRIEFSVGRGADYVAREVRNRHELIVGSAGTPGMDQSIINITNAVLAAALRDEIIASYDPKATVLRADGLVRYIDYSATPVLPINWIFSTYHLLPTNFTLTL